MNNRRAFIVGIKSTKLNRNEVIFLKKYKPWGIILFARNVKSINQTKNLTDSIKKIFKDKKYPILIDQEGGRINRLKNLISYDTLTSQFFGKLYLKDKKKFEIYYKLFIEKTCFILKYLGININTVPVLDLNFAKSNNIIGDRSFSRNPKIVSKIGNFCINSYHKNSIGTVIKHIPGHGLAKVDSHKFTPYINEKISFLKNNDFYPFKRKKSYFAMTAHVVLNSIDKKNTVTHSKKAINFIRNKIGFKNLLISDDLSMKSLKFNLSDNTKKAFSAGCNLALHCNGSLNEMKLVAIEREDYDEAKRIKMEEQVLKELGTSIF